jgi:hypothetical protein
MASSVSRERIGVIATVFVLSAAFFIASAPRSDDAATVSPVDVVDQMPRVTTIASPAPAPTRPQEKPPGRLVTEGIAELPPPQPPTAVPASASESPAAVPLPARPAAHATRAVREQPAPERTLQPGLTLEDYFAIMNDEKRLHGQREARIRPYTGQVVTWYGFVREVPDGVEGGAGAGLLAISPTTDRSWDLAICWFDEVEQKNLGRLRPGDRVAVTGRLEAPTGMGPVLRGCRLGSPAQ